LGAKNVFIVTVTTITFIKQKAGQQNKAT